MELGVAKQRLVCSLSKCSDWIRDGVVTSIDLWPVCLRSNLALFLKVLLVSLAM